MLAAPFLASFWGLEAFFLCFAGFLEGSMGLRVLGWRLHACLLLEGVYQKEFSGAVQEVRDVLLGL